jgi:membrane protein DedA with SNARE-associated domain
MAEWLLGQDGLFLYVALLLMLLGGAIGLPIPEDLPLILAGVLAHAGRVNVELVALVCYVGVVVGDVAIFAIGRWLGPSLFQKRWFRSRFPASKIRRLRVNLERRSFLMILVARHLFYLRTATFLTCGAVRMSPYRFIAADALAALISLPLMIGIGYFAAEHVNALLEGVHNAKHIVALIGLVMIVALIYRRLRRVEEDTSASGEPAQEQSQDTATSHKVEIGRTP